MKSDKIQKFYSSCHEYLEKKHQIEQMTFDLKYMLDKVNDDLNNIIDNGFQTEYLADVANEYNMYKFESKVVQDFIEKIDKLMFAKLDISKKDRLEIVSLSIPVVYHHSYVDSKAHINGPIAVDFIDVISNRSFTIFIPVKNCTRTDVLHWTQNGNGLYIVSTDKFGPSDICRVFDPSKVADAVEKLLNGDFDEDLPTIDISDAYEKHKYLFDFEDESNRHDVSRFLSKTLFADEYDDDDDYYYFKRSVPGCIDDTRNFK